MKLIPVLFLMLFMSPIVGMAQKELSDAETRNFFDLIKQTKEFKSIKVKADSINKQQPGKAPQEVEVHIVKKENEAPDDNIFRAVAERTVIGMALEGYTFGYDKLKKQIISIQKNKPMMQLN